MELQSIATAQAHGVKTWLGSSAFRRLMGTCTLAHAKLEPRRQRLSGQVADRAVAIARELGLGDQEIIQLELAAHVHRIGELFLHESLRSKSFLDMSSVEMKAYRQYPIFSAFRLSTDARTICDVILKHREYFSGDGFLENDSDCKVPFAARILCVATEYEELIMFRGFSPEVQDTIQRRMFKNTIGRYDQNVINALMKTVVEENIIH
jgi:response regulator RpfG family c-di-GMP phosphodiesterase